VTSFQRVFPPGRMNSCQKLFYWAADPPITATAQVPAAVTRAVFSDGAGGAGWVVGPRDGGAALPQPAASTAPVRARAKAVR
jgi:hypothetical protein